MTEEDTFNILRRRPIKDLEWEWWNTSIDGCNSFEAYLKKHHYKWIDYMEYHDRRRHV